ncbi:YggT family protein [Solemya velesiana gill symbiont]|nr:YggT family protein [Solemya velesiana gill symbiont]
MDSTYFTNPLVFLVHLIFGVYATIVLLRFLLQLMRADFFNPISQFVVKLTTPVLNPLHRIIPGVAGLDIASLTLAWLVKSVELLLIMLIIGIDTNLLAAFSWAVPELIALLINIFFFAILLQVILSWINPGGYNPAASLLHSLTEPLLRPARRVLPELGGIDISPMLVMAGLWLLQMLLIPPMQVLFASPFR